VARISALNGAHPVAEPANAVSGGTFAPIRALKRVYHTTRRTYERALHGRRHLAATQRLWNAQRPRRILVVCHGNICRSPYLQAVLQRSLPDVTVTSAGFVGSDRPVPQMSVALSAQRGLDLSRYRSRPITQSKVRDADLVIVMDSEQAMRVARMFRVKRERIVIAGDLEPTFETSRAIRDPWNESIEVFTSSFDRLDRCAASLVKILRHTQSQP
jgi:protein-tyrosine phosphatase